MFYSLLVLIGLSGAAIGRWWALLIPVVVWPIFYLGVAQEWWGSGLGDGWQFGLLIVLTISLAAVAIGVALRLLVRPRAERPAPY